MNNIFKHTLVLLVVLSTSELMAQTGTLNYRLSSKSIVTGGEQVSISSTIEKTGNILIWTQSNNGKVRTKSLQVNGQSGNWDPNSSTGTVQYGVSVGGLQGTLALSGAGSGLRATLTLNVTETGSTETIIFNIESITYL